MFWMFFIPLLCNLFTAQVSRITTTHNAIYYQGIAINCHVLPCLAPFTTYLPGKQEGYSLPKYRDLPPRITLFTTGVSPLTATFYLG